MLYLEIKKKFFLIFDIVICVLQLFLSHQEKLTSYNLYWRCFY